MKHAGGVKSKVTVKLLNFLKPEERRLECYCKSKKQKKSAIFSVCNVPIGVTLMWYIFCVY